MLTPDNFKEYTVDMEKELFLVTLKGGIPEEKLDEYINYIPIIRSIEIGNKSKKNQKKLTRLMTIIGLHMSFSSYYL
jgi:hypothetical protein